MKFYFGYIRVSTAKQGAHGVSLTEQRSAIERYAQHNGLRVAEWFEERETAAKRGRAVFARMLSLLRSRKASGVIIHKIDRSARNLKDWADLGDLIDAGVEVHFAADALDLNSRGGRLSADIQAVVAADYIRNLREETRKGFYGRLKQGLYPLPAPLGYLDQGGGKEKTLDPKTAPLVRRVFELYGSGNYSLRSLLPEVARMGLRSPRASSLSVQGLATMLHNPFYCGLIRLRKTGETFKGRHAPLISVALFDRVQRVLAGKVITKVVRHAWLFRRLIHCALCGYALTGERQKGHVYYRCHTLDCPTTGVREDVVQASLRELYERIQLTPDECIEAGRYLRHRERDKETRREATQASIKLQLAAAKERLNRLTDALVDGLIERPAFEARRSTLLLDVARLEEGLHADSDTAHERASKFLELASSLIQSHDFFDDDEKRRLVQIATSNLSVSGKKLAITASEPFLTLANRHSVTSGAPIRSDPRTSCQPRQMKAVKAFVDYLLKDDRSKSSRAQDQSKNTISAAA